MKTKEIILIPNLLSILRLILAFPVFYLLLFTLDINKALLICLFIFMFITDLLDGYLARKRNEVTETGKIIDPLADKLVVGLIALAVVLKGIIPLWFFLVIISRDLLILIFGLYLNRKYNKTLMSNYPGKAAVFGIGLILLLSIINSELLNSEIRYLYYVVLVLIIYSSILYLNRFFKTIGDIKNGK